MFFKIIFLIIILFLFFINKNIESFSGCLPRYYNEHVEIDTFDRNISGFLRDSNDDEIIINPIDSSDNITISRNDIENIRIINYCPNNSRDSIISNTREIFMDMGVIKPDKTPCDITDNDYQKIKNYNLNNWISEDYQDPSNYCKTTDNVKCNKINYDFDCNEIINESYNSYDHIDYCDNLYDEENNILQYTSQDCINSCENSNQIFLDSLTPAEIQAHAEYCSDNSDENCSNFCNGEISGTLSLCSEESKQNHIRKLRELHNNDAIECDETGLNSSWNNFLNNGNTTCGCINRNTFEDTENKEEKVHKAIQQQMKKNCYTLGDKCKGFSYKIEEDLTSQIVEFSNNEFDNDEDHRIRYNGSYYNDCQLNNHINYDADNTTVKTFIKKNLSSNDNICES